MIMYIEEMEVVAPTADVVAAMDQLVAKAKEDVSLRENLKHAIDSHAIAALAKTVGIEITPRQLSQFLSLKVMGMAEEDFHSIAGAPARCSWTCTRNSRA